MANTSKSGRSRSNSSSRGSKKSPSKSSTRSNTTRRTTKSAPVANDSVIESGFKKFASSKAATPVIFIAAVLLITGIDLLVSWNKFELFFKILGVEILIAVAVWIVMTLVFSRRNTKDSSESLEDEV